MKLIGIESYLLIGLVLFIAGLFTAISRKNIIGIFMGIELILNASALNFAAFSRFSSHNMEGQLFTIFIIVIAAAEAAIALALMLAIFRRSGDIDAEKLDSMRG